jgi:hypothetical protein
MKRKNYRCNQCGDAAMFNTTAQMIAHYRKEHPEDGYGLWDAIGDLGDKFANGAVEGMRERARALQERLTKAEAKAKAYDALVPRYDALIRCVQIIKPALESAIAETNR